MSRRRGWARERAELFAEDEPAAAPAASPRIAVHEALVGRDLAEAPRRARRRSRAVLPLAIGGIVAALLLAALRVEIIRLRYALADVASQEEQQFERLRQTTVRVRELRDPARLRKLAAARGFARPERVLTIELPEIAAAAPPVSASATRHAPGAKR